MTEEIPSEFWQGIEEFNQHEFYACHDTLEALWMEASEPEKRFYQGVLQIAVGCYHLGNLNWRGAVILLGEGMRRLEAYEPAYSGIDVTELREQSAELLTALQEAGAENVVDFVEQMQQDENVSHLPKILRIEA
ncbi:DUF309 domain-containing protein [Coleofasciculus sp. FACHB-712]|uniref:DUF309 domain-containing protein n=1 Tax=Cyanophyceae TaxID=3028117 RepID=UPI001681E80F|nr:MULTISPECIES: DUF309 domain-containing protein [unclassified Coleofasciculus]MBD1941058.1 DUF309 domain-containing protein [Coleofasciculus sp. FACHB-712]MBD2542163.1 DUF309 domain-containing protein [Coleofasciculus sp. FACHB-SPT36]